MIAPGRNERIEVKKGENPRLRANNFAKKFGIGKDMTNTLEFMLTQAISKVYNESNINV